MRVPRPSRTLPRVSTANLDAPATLPFMEVNFRPETESRLQELAQQTGRAPNDLIEDAMAGYLQELGEVRQMLDGRYDDLKNGRVKAVEGETAFAELRRKSQKRRSRS
jgi:predicted transcriptional regulator